MGRPLATPLTEELTHAVPQNQRHDAHTIAGLPISRLATQFRIN